MSTLDERYPVKLCEECGNDMSDGRQCQRCGNMTWMPGPLPAAQTIPQSPT